MMRRLTGCALAAVAMLAAGAVPSSSSVIRSPMEAISLPDAEFASNREFELSGVVVAAYPSGLLFIKGSDSYFETDLKQGVPPKPGDVATVTGYTYLEVEGSSARNLLSFSVTVTGKAPLPTPERATVAEVAENESSYRFVTVKGVIIDAFADEIDSGWNYLIIRDGDHTAYAAVPNTGTARDRLRSLIDAEVELTGTTAPGYAAGFRIFIGPYMRMWNESCIRILKPAPSDPFSLRRLESLHHVSPSKIAAMRRRTAVGHVVAVWSGGHFLLREDAGRIIGVELIDSSSVPECGERVKVVGYPETDLYRINLARASFRREEGPSAVFPPPEAAEPRDILLDSEGNPMIKPYYHGRLVRMRGEIVTLPEGSGGERILNLDCDGFLVPVDVSAHPEAMEGLDVGCDVKVTGVCVLKSPNWCPTMLFPRIDGLVLVPRSKSDLRVVSRPSWWTVERLIAIVGVLVAIIVGILAWNWSLRRLAERRGRELLRAEMSKATAELRIDERTRLAAELHDSLAQNLTGVSLQISAARSARATSPEAEEHHLCIAEQMLQSNRTELRRCIWDLRSDVLDEKDFTRAVRRTTQPVAGQSELEVDCAIPRSRLSDSTAHAILRIIRELVSNAAVHGKAAHIRIKGQARNGVLGLSVSDDGSGFDIRACPGQTEGHFGLAGIRERCKGLGAKLVVKSEPGRGTTVSMEMKLHEG